MMSAEVSRAGAKLVQRLNSEGQDMVRSAVLNAVEIDDVSEPVRSWLRDLDAVPDELRFDDSYARDRM